MLSLTSLPTFAQPQTAYVQVGQIPVGQESAQQRLQRIRPVEQTSNARGITEDKPQSADVKRSSVGETSEQDKRKQAQQAVETKIEQSEHEQLTQMSARDREVRAHEQAHKAVAGSYGGAIHFEYRRGPDGNRYAVGGEVSIDTSPESSPEATLAKARTIQRAANAPAEPSDQDRAVAAQAAQMELLALQQLAEVRQEGSAKGDAEGTKSASKPDASTQPASTEPAAAGSGAPKSSTGVTPVGDKPVGSTTSETPRVAQTDFVDTSASHAGSRAHAARGELEAQDKRLGLYRKDAELSLNFHTHA